MLWNAFEHIDLSSHRSKGLSVEMIHQADFVVTMNRYQVQNVVELVPSAAEKTSALDPEGDIEDPIGGDLALYSQTAERIQSLIERRWPDGIVP